jgi:hypothetical protein
VTCSERSASTAAAGQPRQIEHVAIATGIDPATIERMLLWRYAGRAFQRPTGRLDTALAAAAQGSEVLIRCSRFCPHCLHERGAWLLSWQLRWSFACAAHRVLLLRRCPTCAAVIMSALRENWPSDNTGPFSDPTRCAHHSRRGLCRGRLERAATPTVSDPTLAAQRRINLLLDHGGPNPTLAGVQLDPPSYLRDLSKLCTLVHRCTPTSPQQRCPSWSGHRVRDHPADLAAALPTALALADLPDPATLADALRKLADDRYHNDGLTLVFIDTDPMSEPLKLAIRHAITRAIWTSASRQVGLHPGAHRRPADLDPRLRPQHVPQLFWAEDYHREIAELLDVEDSTDSHGRRFCSMLLTRMLSPMGRRRPLPRPPRPVHEQRVQPHVREAAQHRPVHRTRQPRQTDRQPARPARADRPTRSVAPHPSVERAPVQN